MKIELSHDILARKIYEKASAEDKMILKIEYLVKDNYMRYQERNVLMSREDYDYIAPFLSSINITTEEQTFIDKSIASIRRKQRMLNLLILSAIIILTIFGAVASFQSFQAQQRAVAIEQQNLVLNQKSDSLIAQSEEILAQQQALYEKSQELELAYNKAVLKEQEAEAAAARADRAARVAEANAKEAEAARDSANNLRVIAEANAKEAERLRDQAEKEKIISENLRNQAVAARDSAKVSLAFAREQKAKADALKGLAEARVLANKAIRLINEGNLAAGMELSLEAYQLNDSLGGPYQNADCYAALSRAYDSYLTEKRNKLNEQKLSQLYKPHNAAIRCVATDSSKIRRNIVAYATEDEQIYVVEPKKFHRLKIKVPLSNKEIKPRSIALSHDGNLLIVGTYSGHLIAYEYLNGKYQRLQASYNQYEGAISYIQVVEPIKGAYYIAFADQRHVHLGYISLKSSRNQFNKELSINIQNKFELKGIRSAAFSNDGKYLIAVNNSIAQILEVTYNFPRLDFSTTLYDKPLSLKSLDNDASVTASGIGKDSKGRHLVALGLKNGGIRITDLDNLNCLINNENCEFDIQAEHKSQITGLVFNKAGDQLISSSLDKTAKIWNLEAISEDRIPLVGHDEWIWDLAYSENQDEIFTVGEDRFVKTWVSRSSILADKVNKILESGELKSDKEKLKSFRERRNNNSPTDFRDGNN